ncbi:hypothetical protein A1F94_012979 [Pyrenophora tritici-repentis]|uniref:Uncharacterized protein n=1 Tax=Pyrenophora tritici-repentis TaxID=45151 RepID=A0A2W1ECI6_9PLEO|nr:hypothetical protein PtrV1_09627 [Pyrenophora tritici-repentis]KAF7442919.1 hypothetical protein A1F99_124260 [Pyrenophora tritici-repentis]KAF7568621.1 hypothetical protein PtrM4_132340 [Pyrenophora tritici-repentis]KAG9376432.1 hypothetical protein A1F94_012979 [Pyrenophora tritici-repentis]KAI0591187.1 hypothetical protein Alg130_01492 [Pyrenophora tritici-repentis]
MARMNTNRLGPARQQMEWHGTRPGKFKGGSLLAKRLVFQPRHLLRDNGRANPSEMRLEF